MGKSNCNSNFILQYTRLSFVMERRVHVFGVKLLTVRETREGNIFKLVRDNLTFTPFFHSIWPNSFSPCVMNHDFFSHELLPRDLVQLFFPSLSHLGKRAAQKATPPLSRIWTGEKGGLTPAPPPPPPERKCK